MPAADVLLSRCRSDRDREFCLTNTEVGKELMGKTVVACVQPGDSQAAGLELKCLEFRLTNCKLGKQAAVQTVVTCARPEDSSWG